MRKIKLMAIFLLSVFILNPVVSAEDEHASFASDDTTVELLIYGEDTSLLEGNDYTILDITDEVYEDDELLEKIYEYGTLLKAVDISVEDLDKELIDYDNVVLNIILQNKKLLFKPQPIVQDNVYKPGALRLDEDGNLIPLELADLQDMDVYTIYSFEHLYELGKIFIIDPIIEEFTLKDELGSVNFEYFKYKQYNDTNFILREVFDIADDFNIARGIAEEKNIDMDALLEETGSDYVLDFLIDSKDRILASANDEELNRVYLNTYGFYIFNNFDARSIWKMLPIFYEYPPVEFNVSLKLNEQYSDYTDFGIYTIDPLAMVKTKDKEFDINKDYYYYDKELRDYFDLIFIYDGYVVGDEVPQDKLILEETQWGYYKAFSDTVLFGYKYYSYNGFVYTEIKNIEIGDLLSDYGDDIYVYANLKITEDSNYEDEKVYYEFVDNGFKELKKIDFHEGDTIASYVERTGNTVYTKGLGLSPIDEKVILKDGYLNFKFKMAETNDGEPVFVLTGKKKVPHKVLSNNRMLELTVIDSPDMVLNLSVNNDYTLNIDNIRASFGLTDLTDEELQAIVDKIKSIGNLVELYDINMAQEDGTPYTEGPFEFRLKKSDKASNYESFKFINITITEEGVVKFNDEIALNDEGEYITGELPHLSVYALLGTEKEDPNIKVPKANDSIILFSSLFIISIAGIFVLNRKYN